MGKLFGTDGIRAVVGKYPLVESFVRKLGYVAFNEFSRGITDKNIVFIGRDTRESGREILKWLFYGLRSAGARKVIDLGVIPTPAISYLTKENNALFGTVISASHNPPQFNGIKFFDPEGKKISKETELQIEKRLEREENYPHPKSIQTLESENLTADYRQFLIGTVSKLSLKDSKIAIDCANGAAYDIAPHLFKILGAQIVASTGCEPNGKNINTGCGALHCENMQKLVRKHKADIGISFDGDADRVILSDELGRKFDGDDIMAMAAVELKRQNKLKNNRVVLTVMSNAGLVSYLKQNGISAEIVAVGDRHVSQKLGGMDLSLGGEASGHIIFRDFAPTGDGLLTVLQILAMLKESHKPLSYFKDRWIRYPSVLKAVTVKEKIPLGEISGFEEKRKMLEKTLGSGGRIFLRYSGTEPKLRILTEGPNEETLKNATDELIDFYKKAVEEICR